jgi:hypothetical protein
MKKGFLNIPKKLEFTTALENSLLNVLLTTYTKFYNVCTPYMPDNYPLFVAGPYFKSCMINYVCKKLESPLKTCSKSHKVKCRDYDKLKSKLNLNLLFSKYKQEYNTIEPINDIDKFFDDFYQIFIRFCMDYSYEIYNSLNYSLVLDFNKHMTNIKILHKYHINKIIEQIERYLIKFTTSYNNNPILNQIVLVSNNFDRVGSRQMTINETINH